MHTTSPATIPATAPSRVVRFQNTPSTSTGNRLDAASENAAPTRNRMLPVFNDATYDANNATPQRPRRDQPRHHIGQPRDLRRRQHDHVGLHLDLAPAHHPITAHIRNA